jgi:large subunit ribosomal protein L19
MNSVLNQVAAKQLKQAVVDVRSGDTVRVHQKIKEGGKERTQVFEGLVIRTSRKNSLTSSFTVRRVASGVGVEKTFLIHSPAITKVQVVRRSKVRRNYLSYMRQLTGKGTRLTGLDFDKDAVNTIAEEMAESAADAEVPDTPVAELPADEPATGQPEAKVEELKDEADKIEEKPKLKHDAKNPAEPQNKEKK